MERKNHRNAVRHRPISFLISALQNYCAIPRGWLLRLFGALQDYCVEAPYLDFNKYMSLKATGPPGSLFVFHFSTQLVVCTITIVLAIPGGWLLRLFGVLLKSLKMLFNNIEVHLFFNVLIA